MYYCALMQFPHYTALIVHILGLGLERWVNDRFHRNITYHARNAANLNTGITVPVLIPTDVSEDTSTELDYSS